jgi:hypothetical protein
MSQEERHGLVAGLERLLQIAGQDMHDQSISPTSRAGDGPVAKRNTGRSHHR